MSLRASAHTGVAIPWMFRYVFKTFGDCHTSDIGHWFAMTLLWQRKTATPFGVAVGYKICYQESISLNRSM